MDPREGARREQSVLVVGEKLHQQRARFLIDRVRGGDDRRVELAVRVLGQFEGCFYSVLKLGRVRFAT